MRLSSAQQRVLRTLVGRGGSQPLAVIAAGSSLSDRVAARSLDSLFSRSLVTVTPTGQWVATERGRRKLAREMEAARVAA